MKKILHKNILHISKWSGLFTISRRLTKRGLRILCYHGISDGDENEWLPGLYIKPKDLERRIRYLTDNRFPVLNLEKAVNLLKDKKLPPYTTVITIDDGFYNTISHGSKVLKNSGYPYTIYVSSYYSQKESPVFNLAVSYLFWKTRKEITDFIPLGIKLLNNKFDKKENSRRAIEQKIIDFGQKELSHEGRNDLIKRLGVFLDVNTDSLFSNRKLSLMNSSEIKLLSSSGVDIQLHTHRHVWPTEKYKADLEIKDNRLFLEPLVGKKLTHFCYPSGYWRYSQIDYLKKMDIKTATTCDSGFNYSNANLYLLRRFVDNSKKKMIVFEAEMNGFYEFLALFRKSKTFSKNSGYRIK